MIEECELPGDSNDDHLELKITNPNHPSDKVAIQIDKLAIGIKNKTKTEFSTEIEKIKILEKEEQPAIEELKQLEALQNEEKKKIEEIEEEKKKPETNLMVIDKQLIEKKNELKRKFGHS
ncbi:unnamed protein product [Rotaria sordida]|uniref:Uncharacterized protein n=1 Tax=Rotaria sordida TaxID=392033 RepID=A0A813R7Z8_9BILA|nr:unnamed protein product [Rotaria sordida]CAF0876484.1 unnamed protein product [Rotaria sordida]CAF3702841.1 unnamed protein product [Rotaria sordida]CAF3912456.1 unnamed protein product [Rotaria sordida]